MILGKRPLPVQGTHHRHLNQFGQRLERLGRPRIKDPLTGHNHWRLGRKQQVNDRFYILGVRIGAMSALRVVWRRVGGFGQHHIAGELEHDRPRLAGSQQCKGPLHHLRDLAYRRDRLRPLGDMSEVAAHFKIGRNAQPCPFE